MSDSTATLPPYDPPPGGYPAGRLGKGKWNWYNDGERLYRPVTKGLEAIDTDTYNLDRWKDRQVVEGMAARPDLVLLAQSVGRAPQDPELKKTLNDIAWKARQAAKVTDGANLGTAMHNATEAVDRGAEPASFAFPEPYASALRDYASLRVMNGVKSIEIERTVRIPELDWAGTFDRLDIWPGIGELLGKGGPDSVIVDVKTEEEPWRNGMRITAQLGTYAHADALWVPGLGWVAMPPVRTDVAIVVHVRNGTAVPYLIDIREGWIDAQRAATQIARVSAAKTEMGNPGARFAPLPHKRAQQPMLPLVAEAAERESRERGLLGEGAMATHRQLVEHSIGAPAADTNDVDAMFGTPPPVTDTRLLPAPGASMAELAYVAQQTEERHREWLISEIWQAPTREALAGIYASQETIGFPVPWVGPVAMAGEARLRVVECPQRALHTDGKCACGWTAGIAP